MHSDDHRADVSPDAHRLPRTARPVRYDLELAPDLATAAFAGSVVVALEVLEATDVLVCNAAELEVTAAWVEVGGRRIAATAVVDEDAERCTVTLESTLGPGPATLHLAFRGGLNDKLRGFYRSTFTDPPVDGEGSAATRTIAVTQFEATDARRAFPCWDEPEHKAVFGVTLVVAEDLVAVSNGPELSRRPAGDGRVAVTFADTMPMSTYLVAFAVGPLEASRTVQTAGVPMRVLARPGQVHLTEFALEVGAFALQWFADYYGIAYPGDKLDMVAVPDFAFGAMENLGCVVYRESLLLVDPATATQAELQAVADVIAHELAHMWFGDLVTMRWWNGIWLNEAFATFMEAKACDALRPEWQRWQHFGRERSGAFDVDALAATRPIEYPVLTPADAEGMFDTLTYQKGSAVVRMLEQYLGEQAFRDGIRRYLQTHQFSNTETSDLWDALEAETGEPVRAMMDSWIFQGGFPLVTARRDGDRLALAQSRFRSLPEAAPASDEPRWHVPVLVRHDGGTSRTVLDGATGEVRVSGDGPPVVNAGGHAFYRVAYDTDHRQRLLDRLADLEPLERYALLDDAHALTRAGRLPAADLAALVARLAATGEDDLSIWQLAAVALDDLHRAVPADRAGAVSAWIRAHVQPLWGLLGPEPAAGDDDRRRALRGLVLGLLGTHDDPDARALAEEVFDADRGSRDAEVTAAATRVVALHADDGRFEALLDRFRHAPTTQEQHRSLYAAANVADPALFDRYLDLLTGTDVRSQNLAFAYRAALGNAFHGPRAWAAVEDRWDAIRDRLPFNAVHRMVEGVSLLSDPVVAERVAAFLAGRDVPEAGQLIAQHVERMRVRVALRQREGDRLVDQLP